MSSSDMWQPKQPHSDVVAILGFAMTSPSLRRRRRLDLRADRGVVEEPLADRHGEADALAAAARPTGQASTAWSVDVGVGVASRGPPRR